LGYLAEGIAVFDEFKENSGVYFDHDNNSFAEQSGWVGKDVHIKPNIIHFVSCACCGGKATLLFMGVVISIYFIRVIRLGR
jgi:hypothetical protein